MHITLIWFLPQSNIYICWLICSNVIRKTTCVPHTTDTCFIQKIYAPSSSLRQGKHLPFTPFPLRLNIFRLFVILSLTQLYRYTPPRYFSFRLPHLNINIGPPSEELDKNNPWRSHFLFFSQWNGYSHFGSVLNWFRS
jgi:hypothetical protein